MAEPETKQRNDTATVNRGNELKYLDFVKAAVLYAIVCLAMMYEHARGNSGPLKPGVQAVEGSVRSVIGPVYRKFHGVPFNLLRFLDRKVDESIQRLDRCVPAPVKAASRQALMAAQRTPSAARSMVSEVQRAGLADAAATIARDAYEKCEPTSKELYAKYEPVAVQYAAFAWQLVRRVPVIPKAVKCGLKSYNWAVRKAVLRGYPGATYMPLIPLERIAKALRERRRDNLGDNPAVGLSNGGDLAQ